jgi:hypothetical protein
MAHVGVAGQAVGALAPPGIDTGKECFPRKSRRRIDDETTRNSGCEIGGAEICGYPLEWLVRV